MQDVVHAVARIPIFLNFDGVALEELNQIVKFFKRTVRLILSQVLAQIGHEPSAQSFAVVVGLQDGPELLLHLLKRNRFALGRLVHDKLLQVVKLAELHLVEAHNSCNLHELLKVFRIIFQKLNRVVRLDRPCQVRVVGVVLNEAGQLLLARVVWEVKLVLHREGLLQEGLLAQGLA